MRLEIWFGDEKKYYDRARSLGAGPKTAKQTASLLADDFSGWSESREAFMADDAAARRFLKMGGGDWTK